MKRFFDVLAGLAHIGWYALVGVAAMLILAEFVRVHGVPGVCQ
jgi:hypothetical protein